jgi:hypothetical protein
MAAVALVVAGCGDDPDSGSVGTGSPATTASTTAAPSGAAVTITGPTYDKTFAVTECANAGETDLKLTGIGDGDITLTLDIAEGGTGTIAIAGGNEQDGILLNGTVDALAVGDAGNITGSGEFSEESSGEENATFTISGTCA